MLNRVNKVLIGKDIDRTALCAAGATVKTVVANAVSGEILVLDKNKTVLQAGKTIADSDVIYICQGTGKTFNYTNELGTAVTGARELIFSDPIQGKKVRSFKGRSFDAKSEEQVAIVLDATVPTLGREYIIRLVYTDMEEYPSQFTQTYRHIATAADVAAVDTMGASLAAKINAHSGRRVVATYTAGTNTLLIKALPIPECTTAVTDIDEFKQVTFKCYYNYVNASGNWAAVAVTSNTHTDADPGSGTWEQVRDLEKEQFAYRGVSNFTQFPVIKPDFCTVKDTQYDLLVIESEREYLSPGINSYQTTPLTTIVALPINALQVVNILACLNPWMASTPGNFSAVTF
jgi:hypothetical protein